MKNEQVLMLAVRRDTVAQIFEGNADIMSAWTKKISHPNFDTVFEGLLKGLKEEAQENEIEFTDEIRDKIRNFILSELQLECYRRALEQISLDGGGEVLEQLPQIIKEVKFADALNTHRQKGKRSYLLSIALGIKLKKK